MLVVIDHQESAFIKLMIIRRGRQYKKSDHRSDRFFVILLIWQKLYRRTMQQNEAAPSVVQLRPADD
jgi:hypothetical protein